KADVFSVTVELNPPEQQFDSAAAATQHHPMILMNIYLTSRKDDKKDQHNTFRTVIRQLLEQYGTTHHFIIAGDINEHPIKAQQLMSPFDRMLKKSPLSDAGENYTFYSTLHGMTEIDHVWTSPSLMPITTSHFQSTTDHN